jgi:LysR family transcriptional regulator, benzoate and cis,cis-muconate-responsive activator of ben and cat genes
VSDNSEPKSPRRVDPHGIEVRHLRYFIAIAEEMNFGRAAQRLHVAQPALSRQIANLEADLGGPLFDRTRPQIKLTAAGAALLPRAREWLLRLNELVDLTRRVGSGSEGVLEIGFVGSATFSILPEILKEYRSRYPRVELLLHHLGRAELVRGLVNRQIQVAFTRPGIDDAQIANDVLLREPLVVALPADDPLAARNVLSLRALADKPFILPSPRLGDDVQAIFGKAGLTPLIGQETADLHTALALVAAGMGLAVVPDSVTRVRWAGVAYRPLRAPRLYTDFTLSYRRDNAGELLAAFRKFVLASKDKKAAREKARAAAAKEQP